MDIDRRTLLALPAMAVVGTSEGNSTGLWRPTRSVNCIVPFTAGGGTDAVLRHVKDYAQRHGVTLVADYRPGAEGLLGMRAGAAAPTDGHHLTFGTIGTMSHVQDGWGAAENHQLITGLRGGMFFLVTGATSGINSFADLIERLKTPGVRITGGSGAPGQRAAMEGLLKSAGINDAVIANYRGAAGVAQDLAGNHIQWGMIPGSAIAGAVSSGHVRLLATDRRRGDADLAPGTPSIFDTLDEYPRTDCQLVAAPRGISPTILQFWTEFFRTYVNDPVVREDVAKEYSINVPFGPAYLEQRVRSWRETIPPVRGG